MKTNTIKIHKAAKTTTHDKASKRASKAFRNNRRNGRGRGIANYLQAMA